MPIPLVSPWTDANRDGDTFFSRLIGRTLHKALAAKAISTRSFYDERPGRPGISRLIRAKDAPWRILKIG